MSESGVEGDSLERVDETCTIWVKIQSCMKSEYKRRMKSGVSTDELCRMKLSEQFDDDALELLSEIRRSHRGRFQNLTQFLFEAGQGKEGTSRKNSPVLVYRPSEVKSLWKDWNFTQPDFHIMQFGPAIG